MPEGDSHVPRNEYPRPQFRRERWRNLNGEWEFDYDDQLKGLTEEWFNDKSLSRHIVVPFAYQTSLSGVNDKGVHEVVWYARNFTIPGAWKSENILMHFGAVDYETKVWINGQEAKHNRGGHVPFSLDITSFLKEGNNRVTVRVIDRQDPQQPRGKQSVSGIPGEIDYYNTTGIWQTVWLEPVSRLRIDDIRITPVLARKVFEVYAYLHAPSAKWRLEATVYDDSGEEVTRAMNETNSATISMTLPIFLPRLWSPDDPHLYDMEFKLYQGDELYDTVATYSGMRKVSIEGNAILLNNEPIYLAMVLDQGYWPDGGITAPSDTALKADIEHIKSFGFNGARKHQKIEDPRWLYWCDKLGLLVSGEMANAREWSPNAEEHLLSEWERAVRRDYNHPCIVMWAPMNESWGVPGLRENQTAQYSYLERVVHITRRLDATRIVVDNDGWEHTDIGDVLAIHDYAANGFELVRGFQGMLNEGKMRDEVWAEGIHTFALDAQYHGQPVVLSEVGGFLLQPDEKREDLGILNEAYHSVRSPDEMMAQYEDLMGGMEKLNFIAGYCYTQLIDVEQEINGLMTYDRQPKVPFEEVARINQRLIESHKDRAPHVVRSMQWWRRTHHTLRNQISENVRKARIVANYDIAELPKALRRRGK